MVHIDTATLVGKVVSGAEGGNLLVFTSVEGTVYGEIAEISIAPTHDIKGYLHCAPHILCFGPGSLGTRGHRRAGGQGRGNIR